MRYQLFERVKSFCLRRYKWYVIDTKARKGFKNYDILDSFASIQYILDNGCSVSRYGDGELSFFCGVKEGYQEINDKLIERLKQVLKADDAPNHIVGIPFFLKNVDGTVKITREFWGDVVCKYGEQWRKYIPLDKRYIDTQLSRFYIEYADYDRSTRQLRMLRQIWQDRDVVIIEGCQSRTGVGNDLYDNARQIERILGFPKDGFSHYAEMLDAVKEHVKPEEGKLLLLSYGPTATILAYDLAKLGYQAVDIGHLDIEYEWYKRRTPEGGIVKGKYTNEAKDGDVVDECNDSEYFSQIICDITR